MFEIDHSTGSIWKRWKAKHPEDGPFTEQDLRLMEAVRKAITAGLFYNTDVDAFVANELGVTTEQREIQPPKERGANRVEGGCFGYEVYFARKAVEMAGAMAENRAALARHGYQVGQKLGKVMINHKTARGAIITAIKPNEVEFSAVLVNRKCVGRIEPRRLQDAIVT